MKATVSYAAWTWTRFITILQHAYYKIGMTCHRLESHNSVAHSGSDLRGGAGHASRNGARDGLLPLRSNRADRPRRAMSRGGLCHMGVQVRSAKQRRKTVPMMK